MDAMKTQRPSTMLSDVRQLVATGVSLSQPNDEGVTLVSKVSCIPQSTLFVSLAFCLLFVVVS